MSRNLVHLDVDRPGMDLKSTRAVCDLLLQSSKIESLRIGDADINTIFNTRLGLKRVHVSQCLLNTKLVDLGFLCRIETLILCLYDFHSRPVDVFNATEWTTLPSVPALKHLRIDFGQQSNAPAAKLIHPGLLTFEVWSCGRNNMSVDVLHALAAHGPPLRQLALTGDCHDDAFLADDFFDTVMVKLFERCGVQLQALMISIDGIADSTPYWNAISTHCRRVRHLHGDFLRIRISDLSTVRSLLQSCRCIESFALHVHTLHQLKEEDPAWQLIAAVTARRNLLITPVIHQENYRPSFAAFGRLTFAVLTWPTLEL